MRKLLVTLVLLAACGCGEDAQVLDASGSTVLAKCLAESWIGCVSKACPDGYVAVHPPRTGLDDGIIRCKPHVDGGM